MRKPFFSIVVPTYNRPKELERAIKSIINQTYKDYEIIISDNSLNWKTKTLCNSFKNKRIRYTKNKTNIGFIKNLYQVIGMAKGKYVFMLGDDDWLGNKRLLENVYIKINQKNYGYVRVCFVYSDNSNYFSKYFLHKINPLIRPKRNALKILDFLVKSIYSSISGVIFFRPKNHYIKEIARKNVIDLDLADFWIKYLFEAIKTKGGWIDNKDVIYVSWSNYQNPMFYNLINNKLPKEKTWSLLSELLSRKEMEEWIKKDTEIYSHMLPSISYYSNRRNLVDFVKRLMVLNKNLRWQIHLYFGLFIGLIMPKWLWKHISKIYIKVQNYFIKKTSWAKRR